MSVQPASVKYCLIDGEVVGETPFPADVAKTKEACLHLCKHALGAYWIEGVRVENPSHQGPAPDLVLVEDVNGGVICHWSRDDELRDLVDRPLGWEIPLWSAHTQTLRQAIQMAAAEMHKGRAHGVITCPSHHILVDEAQISRLWHRLSTHPGMPVAEHLAGVYRSTSDNQQYRFQGLCQFEPYWTWEIALYSTATGPGSEPLTHLSGSVVSLGRDEAARNAAHTMIEVAIDDWVKTQA